jgi:hypothetical protein
LLYFAAYLAYCAAPLDFVISSFELDAKLAGDRVAWWLMDGGETGIRLAAILTLETLAAIPLGLLAALNFGKAEHRYKALYAVAVGAAFGMAIETVQIFLVSGSTQGVSVLTRALGAGIGGYLPALVEKNRREGASLIRSPRRTDCGAAVLLLRGGAARLASASALKFSGDAGIAAGRALSAVLLPLLLAGNGRDAEHRAEYGVVRPSRRGGVDGAFQLPRIRSVGALGRRRMRA